MPQSGLIFRILIASPSDCSQERKAAPEVIYSWNAVNSLKSAAILEPVMWETHATPQMGGRPQALINKQLLNQCDILIGVFWTRLGTHTGVAESGTVEEIEEFRKNGKPVLLYFSSAPVVPASIDPEQYRKLSEYKKEMQDQGLIRSYDSVGEFRYLLQQHLSSTMNDLLSKDQSRLPYLHSEQGSEQNKDIKMFQSQFETFLRRFEAEWSAERDTEPPGIDEGKYILSGASSEILSFMGQITQDGGSGLTEKLKDSLKKIRELARHELYMDGGASYREFWKKGNEVLETLKKIPQILEEVLNRASSDRKEAR